ncbi:MAG: transglycosylase SLT domain-containing protein, partial [Bdellovibrionales bacterium]
LDATGTPYVTNGYKPMEEALRNDPQPVKPTTPSQPVNPTSPGAAPLELRARLKEFQISRYKKNEFKPSRFGDHRFRITMFFRDGQQVEFNGPLTPNDDPLTAKDGQWKISATADHYTLSGKFTDTVPQKIDGDLNLVDNSNKETAHILYNAYKAKLTVREDRTKKVIPGSVFEQQLKNLRDRTFGWVHNWMVVRGVAFYIVDIVKQVDDGDHSTFAAPIMAFKGESLRTGDEDHPAESLTPKVSSNISLVGNSETSKRRWFQTKFEDPQSKETNDVIIDVQGDRTAKPAPSTGQPAKVPPATGQPSTGQPSAGNDTTDEDDLDDLDDAIDQADLNTPPSPVQPGTPQPPAGTQPSVGQRQPPAQPAPLQPQAPVAPLAPGSSYLKIDMSLPRTARMTRDFARNRKIPGVVAWMSQYANSANWHHNDLTAFYKYANPFRGIIETIGRAYDVSPSFAYLTVIESPYFTGGKYFISSETKSSAVGPFQLLSGTAKSLGMIYSGPYDERRFFAPSACGAARYIAELVHQFEDSDTTVAILGYYQGQGGAAKAIACTYGDQGACGGKNYSRYIALSKSYNYSYAQIDRVAAIPKDQRDYVNKKLAIYFISENISQYGFSGGGMPTLPRNGTVFPSHQINDGVCRQTVQAMTGI